MSGEKTIFRLLSQSLKYNIWRTAPEAKDFERQKNQQRGENRMRRIQKWKKMGTNFCEILQKFNVF